MVYQLSTSDDGGLVCSCPGSEQNKNFSYNDIDLIFGMELSTVKHFDRVKSAVLDALLDLLPPQVCISFSFMYKYDYKFFFKQNKI